MTEIKADKKAKIFNFFTKQPIVPEEVKENTERINDGFGTYIGVLPKNLNDPLQTLGKELDVKRAQLERMTSHFTELTQEYYMQIYNGLVALGVDPDAIDMSKTDVFVDEEGHIWLVPMEGAEK